MNKKMNARDLIEKYDYVEAMLDAFNSERIGLDHALNTAKKDLRNKNRTYNGIRKIAGPAGIVLGVSLIGIGLLGAAGYALLAAILAVPTIASLAILFTTLGYHFKVTDLYRTINHLKSSKDTNERKVNEYQNERRKLLIDIKCYNSTYNKVPVNQKPVPTKEQDKQIDADEMEL